MLEHGKCAKDNSKIFLLNRKKNQNCYLGISNSAKNILATLIKVKIWSSNYNIKDAELRLDVSNILLFMKNHL